MRTIYLLIFITLFSCSDNTSIENQQSPNSNKIVFKKQYYGDKWPFSVDEIEVFCSGVNGVFFRAAGKVYPLNGVAKTQSKNNPSVGKVEEIWLDDPELEGLKIGYPDEFIQEGLKLCEE